MPLPQLLRGRSKCERQMSELRLPARHLSLSRLDVEGYGRHVPRHALGDHGRGRLPVLFKMCRGAMCLQGGCVVEDLVEEHMVRVAVLEQHIERPAAPLLSALRSVSPESRLRLSR